MVLVTNIGANPVPVPLSSIISLTMIYLGVNWLGLYTKVGQVQEVRGTPNLYIYVQLYTVHRKSSKHTKLVHYGNPIKVFLHV